MSQPFPCRASPHRRTKPGYKSPSTHRHSSERLSKYQLLIENFETLNEYYGMDTLKEQYAVQNYYYKMCRTSIGEHLMQKSFFGKKCIVWKNPETGLPIAVLRDLDNYEIPLPNSLSSFEENFIHFQSLWTNLDFDLKLLYKDIGRHISNNNEQCDGCNFPFSPVCSELYCQFDPDPPLPH